MRMLQFLVQSSLHVYIHLRYSMMTHARFSSSIVREENVLDVRCEFLETETVNNCCEVPKLKNIPTLNWNFI